jgi:hypothetical protein
MMAAAERCCRPLLHSAAQTSGGSQLLARQPLFLRYRVPQTEYHKARRHLQACLLLALLANITMLSAHFTAMFHGAGN